MPVPAAKRRNEADIIDHDDIDDACFAMTGATVMGGDVAIRFDDELIEAMFHELDLDCCGVASDCRDDRCPCYLLGRGGYPISVHPSRAGGWCFRRGEGDYCPTFATLEEAVRANQAHLASLPAAAP